MWLPGAVPRLFSARARYTGEVIVLLDVQFTLDLVVRLNGQEIDTKQFKETDVKRFHLYEVNRNMIFLELVFEGDDGAEAAYLKYRFTRYSDETSVLYKKFFQLKPDAMFRNVTRTMDRVEFQDPSYYAQTIGKSEASLLCEKKDTIIFELESEEITDNYDYEVKMETARIQVQAFGVRHGVFGPVSWTRCEPQTLSEKSSPPTTDTLIRGVVGGSVSLLVLVAVGIALAIWRRWRNNVSSSVSEVTAFIKPGTSKA
ncbi:hypothetical protein ElyMa_003321500 [Elysia marginata]|uniref:Uncharacterized protein n=1 Tax=Elysia marginata TaxID=1093978 RepID=A0AAV4JIC3_9GAST|nr:hypothetical protein ElyMa_003321500 [Elysia marginata]